MPARPIHAAIRWACAVFLLSGGQAAADDWTQWRGPKRDGHLPGFTAPKAWPEKPTRAWKIEVGEGHSSPVVAAGRVFVFSRDGDNEVVRAVRLEDGKQVWSQSYPAPYTPNTYARSHGKGPKSTPVVAGGRLFTLGISGVLSCWDAQSGKKLWQREFSKQFEKISPLYGTATSPAVEGNMLIAHVGGDGGGALEAFGVKTGLAHWSWDGDGPPYTSPILLEVGGSRVIFTQSQENNLAASAEDGAILWKMEFKTAWVQNIVTPTVAGDLVVFSGLDKATTAYRFTRSGGKLAAEEVWSNREFPMYTSSPVAVGGRLFGLTHKKKGQFFCLDATTGKTLWTSPGRQCDNAAILAGDGHLLILTTKGELLVLKADADAFEPLRRYKVADTPTWAHPAIVGRRVLVKDRTSLALWMIGD